MPRLPRALIVDRDPDYAGAIGSCLRNCSREIAVRVEVTIEGALNAVETFRPHIIFLSWSFGVAEGEAIHLLRRMTDLVVSDRGHYEHPSMIVNTDFNLELSSTLEEQFTLQFELDWRQVDKASWQRWAPLAINRWYKEKIRALRLLRLSHCSIDLSECSHLRIEDGGLIHVTSCIDSTETAYKRHRDEKFPTISDLIEVPGADVLNIKSLPSLFVKANLKQSWINLAYVENIGYSRNGDWVASLAGLTSRDVVITSAAAPKVSDRLRVLKQWGFWPHLGSLSFE